MRNFNHFKVSTRKAGDRKITKPKKVWDCRGDKCPNAVLNEALVRRIKIMYRDGSGPKKIIEALAKEGIAIKKPTLYNVIYENTWRHVHI